MLERYGVVTREAVLAEGVGGGFASVYGVLKAMEESGTVRRGYFVGGLGAAKRSSGFPASTRSSVAAARWMVSPSGTQAPRLSPR